MRSLSKRILAYENQNISFNAIFNDDYVKYDKHGEFYTFKSQKCNIQLRILYAYITVNNEPAILVVDYWIKKKSSKDYITRFDNYNDVSALVMFQTNKCIAF